MDESIPQHILDTPCFHCKREGRGKGVWKPLSKGKYKCVVCNNILHDYD